MYTHLVLLVEHPAFALPILGGFRNLKFPRIGGFRGLESLEGRSGDYCVHSSLLGRERGFKSRQLSGSPSLHPEEGFGG